MFVVCACSGQVNGVPEPRAASGESIKASRLPNIPYNLAKWIRNPQQVEPGTVMPKLGVSEAEVHDIAAYLYSQPDIGFSIRR